jgi:glycosyltransferase involved in cell wall biosynthesis
MRVLVTNTRLDGRGGTESFMRDLARGLQSRGHTLMAYGSDTQQQERLLDNDVIAVATDLEHLPVRPDVIHAMHHLDAMTAIASLPGVPALYHCHGAVWRESVPKHPRIYRHLAVSTTLAERIAVEFNLAPDTITVLANSVDVARFRRVRSLPRRPARALFFNSRHRPDSDTLAAIREAAARLQMDLDCVGALFGRTTSEPENLLPEYDVVFASGRSAIEAIACGCAVVVLGRTSCGDLVRLENFASLRDRNFSIAVNSPPPSPDRIVAALERFSAEECGAVSARLRQEADFGRTVDALLVIYEQIVEQHRRAEPDPAAEMRAMVRYLRKLVPLIKMTDRALDGEWASPTRADTVDALQAQLVQVRQRVEQIEKAR